MTDEIINMEDMMTIYEITDMFDIDRESISVPLEKQEVAKVEAKVSGILEITLPIGISTKDWIPTLQGEIESLGFSPKGHCENDFGS